MKVVGENEHDVVYYVVQTNSKELLVKEEDEILASDQKLRGPWEGRYGTNEARQAYLEASYVIPHIAA